MALTEFLGESLTEAEKIFREVRGIVFESRHSEVPRESVGAVELGRVVNMAKIVAGCYSCPARAPELAGLDTWVYDLMLKPLLAAVDLESTRPAAASAYRAICMALGEQSIRHEVPVYLSVLQHVETGLQSVVAALRSHRIPLYDASSRYRSG